MTKLVVVESPAKAKTIEKYLGKDYKVLASYGHVRDLIEKDGAVDPDHGYAMKYAVAEDKEKYVSAITAALKKADALYLATDPDREGEAISWHLLEILKERGLLDGKPVHRVVFYEITERAIREAIEQPREVSGALVSAQQARRALDHLLGFKLSPLLWKKISPKLSAGRVQSPALRMIVEREEEIEAFRSEEYWSIGADVGAAPTAFTARLVEYAGRKVVDTFNRERPEPFTFRSAADATAAREALEAAADGQLRVSSVERSQRRRRPAPPFTTSTLQQEASRKLGFRARNTMSIAQKLYEGIAVGEGTVGLITYMRTDSVGLAREAIEDIRGYIAQRYGKASLPERPNVYTTKSKNAQEAHEGIRPTSIRRTPEELKAYLTDEQLKLYTLIWRRTVASQMEPAVYDQLAIELAPAADAEAGRFRATGSTLVSPGFIAVYLEGQDDGGQEEGDVRLPAVSEGELLPLAAITPEQHFTQPPPRYTEASLVKALEERGIGRPSTYASILSTLNTRQYVEMDGKSLKPTDGGRVVAGFLTENFTRYVDYDFTAHMEDELDEISRGERDWVPVLDEFWRPFAELLKNTEERVSREEAAQVRDLGTDPATGKPLTARFGKYGSFIQIGTKDDEEKPKFAGLRPGQSMFTISREQALELFKLPRKVGTTTDGDAIIANIGRFGPYVQYEARDGAGKKQKKYVSLKEHDPYKVTLAEALELIRAKEEADANRLVLDFPDAGIQVLRGRYGPYITDKERNARIPKDRAPETLTLEECQALLAAAPARRGRFARKAGSKAAAKPAASAALPAAAKKVATRKAATRKPPARKGRGGSGTGASG
jgi:DNA topoisomerase-1